MSGITDSYALKRLLCASDFSDGAAAAFEFAIALALARPFPAEILVVYVRPDPVPSGRPMASLAHEAGIDEKGRADLNEALDRCGQAALASGVPSQTVLLQGDPPDEIVREAKRTAADIIVMGRHSRDASNPWLLGSVAERVLRKAPCPVVVVRRFPRHGAGRPRRVLCGLDRGETSASTLKYAVSVANALAADLHVLHVAADGETDRARSAVAAMVASEGMTGPRIQASVTAGEPYQEILAVAREHGTDLIVVGSHGGGVVDRQFLGSTTLHLLRQSEPPVLVVPAHVSQTWQHIEERDEAPDPVPRDLVSSRIGPLAGLS